MTKLQVATISALCALGAVVAPSASQAAHDTQPPVLSTPVKAQFVVGGRLTQFTEGPAGDVFFDAPMRLKWRATDNVDTELNYDVWAHPLGDSPNRIGDFITDTRFNVVGSDYTGFFGGAPLVIDHWSVQAYDNSGNSSQRSIYGAELMVKQDDHTQTVKSNIHAVSLRYTRSWTSTACACFAAGTTHRTNVKKASAVMIVKVPAATDMRRVALVMDKGPARGRAQVRVDGRLQSTIDTKSAIARHQVIVWAGTLGVGQHKIELVNLATPNRRRIDLDAIIVN